MFVFCLVAGGVVFSFLASAVHVALASRKQKSDYEVWMETVASNSIV